MKSIELWQGDCLELMKNIPDGSVDLVLTDPPYGTMKGIDDKHDWDIILDTQIMFAEISRVLRQNGKAILFSQETYTSELIKSQTKYFEFLYKLIWIKNSSGNCLMSKKAPVSFYEEISVFSNKFDCSNNHKARELLQQIQEQKNIFWYDEKVYSLFLQFGIAKNVPSAKMIAKHKLDWNYAQIENINETHYEILKNIYDNLPPYEYIKKIYDEHREKTKPVFNLWQGGKSKSNVLEYKKDNDGYHPTQKPVTLLEDLIQTYSNEGNTVLDFTMGSGSTGVACVNTNRHFIGIELDEGYFNIAKKRIEEAYDKRTGSKVSS